MLREFGPALRFLGVFLGIYVVGNVVYGLWIESYGPAPDHATRWVTEQTSRLLNLFGLDTHTSVNPEGPTVFLNKVTDNVLSIYEGCNGINVMIVFLSFLVAYGGPAKALGWFAAAGLAAIHVFNLFRIGLLYAVAEWLPDYFYSFHKYLFTAILYIMVFVLWGIWIFRINALRPSKV